MKIKDVPEDELETIGDDYEFLCSILRDSDVSDDYPLYRSTDKLVLWLVREMEQRDESMYLQFWGRDYLPG